MKRQDKYPNTEIFHYLNVNPHGRITTDCVIRAIAGAMVAKTNNLNNKKLCKAMWEIVMNDLSDWACNLGYMPTDTKCYSRYLQLHGFQQHKQLRHPDNTKYTLQEFINTHKSGIYLVNMPSHLTLVVNGINYDIWDCTKCDKRVGIYWEKVA